MVVGSHPYAPAAFTPRKYFWYSFLLEAESTPGSLCDRKDFRSMKNPLTPSGIKPATFRFVAQHLNHCAAAVPMLNIFRMFIHPSSGACDSFVELFHGLNCSVRIEVFALAYLFSGECLVVTCVVVLESVFLQILAAAVSYGY